MSAAAPSPPPPPEASFPFELLPTTARERIVGYLPQALYHPVVDALPLLGPHFVEHQWGLLCEAIAKEDSVALLDWYMQKHGYFRSDWDRQHIVRDAAEVGSSAILQMAIVERKW